MFSYFLLGLAGVLEGRRLNNSTFTVFGVLSAVTGAVAVFGGLYYSFVGRAIFVIRLIPWIVLAILLVGVVVALWERSTRPERWTNMGRVFEEA
ncbi:MAG: hypothetical protein ACRD0A_13290 [Acidimicrobiales bacterium]